DVPVFNEQARDSARSEPTSKSVPPFTGSGTTSANQPRELAFGSVAGTVSHSVGILEATTSHRPVGPRRHEPVHFSLPEFPASPAEATPLPKIIFNSQLQLGCNAFKIRRLGWLDAAARAD